MDEISNKTLAILLIGAIVISLGGTLISLNRLARIRIPLITGFDVLEDAASVNLTISPLTAINWTLNAIDWGSGTVSFAKATCTLTSYETNIHENCTTFTANSTGLSLENVGNTNVSLNISTGKNAADFIGHSSAVYQWNVSDLDADSCVGSWNVTEGVWQTASTIHTLVCNDTTNGFRYDDDHDTLKFDVRVVLPSDTPSGAKTDTITATATIIS